MKISGVHNLAPNVTVKTFKNKKQLAVSPTCEDANQKKPDK